MPEEQHIGFSLASKWMCMCVWTHTLCMCTCTHMYSSTHEEAHTCTHIHIHLHIHICTYEHADTYAFSPAYTRTHPHMNMHAWMHTHMHVHLHTHKWSASHFHGCRTYTLPCSKFFFNTPTTSSSQWSSYMCVWGTTCCTYLKKCTSVNILCLFETLSLLKVAVFLPGSSANDSAWKADRDTVLLCLVLDAGCRVLCSNLVLHETSEESLFLRHTSHP